ncbi:FecCD family ABC transporter permease [Paenibacillus thalictri]|uniref:Probable heme-iron transport system permease protein IsdF n=1 Tax=Paenibacillus thalictri TaxID=2527873 RepID=A0A4V2J3M4_9BACL|nr:iron ABC transporter permease [Paenibacillus thalictri]TBL73914.1 iron ABC transporter permease [Paenibacillus thalictri]
MNKKWISMVAVIILLIALMIVSATTGSIKVSSLELIQGLFSGTNKSVQIIKDLRIPRIIIAVFVGAALAVSGVLLQAVMRSPLADAGVIGISSGAGVISLVFVTLFPKMFFWLPVFAFLGGALACFLVYSLSWKSGLSPIRIILVGIAVNATFTGLGQSFNYRGSYAVTSVNQATTSIFAMKTWNDVHSMVLYGSLGLIAAWLLSSWCNLLALQDKSAQNLGLNVSRARLLVSAVAVVLAAVATAIGGLIAFVGLLIPHIARILVGSDHKLLIPFSALAGALLMLSADTLGRTVLAPSEIPASIIMTVIGGPFLIFLLRKSERVHGN